MADQPLLLERLRDEDEDVRGIAEQGLWLLWMRSGDPAIDRALAEGTALMRRGRLPEAIAIFSEIIRRRPAFAEGWNKRATAYFLAGDYRRSLADCGEVIKRNPAPFRRAVGLRPDLFPPRAVRQGDRVLAPRAAGEPEHVRRAR